MLKKRLETITISSSNIKKYKNFDNRKRNFNTIDNHSRGHVHWWKLRCNYISNIPNYKHHIASEFFNSTVYKNKPKSRTDSTDMPDYRSFLSLNFKNSATPVDKISQDVSAMFVILFYKARLYAILPWSDDPNSKASLSILKVLLANFKALFRPEHSSKSLNGRGPRFRNPTMIWLYITIVDDTQFVYRCRGQRITLVQITLTTPWRRRAWKYWKVNELIIWWVAWESDPFKEGSRP